MLDLCRVMYATPKQVDKIKIIFIIRTTLDSMMSFKQTFTFTKPLQLLSFSLSGSDPEAWFGWRCSRFPHSIRLHCFLDRSDKDRHRVREPDEVFGEDDIPKENRDEQATHCDRIETSVLLEHEEILFFVVDAQQGSDRHRWSRTGWAIHSPGRAVLSCWGGFASTWLTEGSPPRCFRSRGRNRNCHNDVENGYFLHLFLELALQTDIHDDRAGTAAHRGSRWTRII